MKLRRMTAFVWTRAFISFIEAACDPMNAAFHHAGAGYFWEIKKHVNPENFKITNIVIYKNYFNNICTNSVKKVMFQTELLTLNWFFFF